MNLFLSTLLVLSLPKLATFAVLSTSLVEGLLPAPRRS